jgi:cysteine synthase A
MQEGIFVGLSSGGILAAAMKVAENAEPGSIILVMLPDMGERYLSTVLFEGMNEGSDDDWLATLS